MRKSTSFSLVTKSHPAHDSHHEPRSLRELLVQMGWCSENGKARLDRLPFTDGDATSGSETELQVAIAGQRNSVDLPLFVEHSDYFSNIAKRAAAGDTPKRLVSDLERFLADNPEQVWENSWVRFPSRLLSPYAQQVFEADLLADKKNPAVGQRGDVSRFSITHNGEECLRLPVSYLLKLALADFLGTRKEFPEELLETGRQLMAHYLNDNTSPETFSFHIVPLSREKGSGRALARETAKRFLFTQLLLMYANERFCLREQGQQALIYFSPHPPIRQQELNSLISDSFYRELFMSPCLSGWDRGEEKYRYMQLCHTVLSRSQLNAVAKLREAGIIINNLVVLPSSSNVSLANNGIHISIGSLRLGRLLADQGSSFTPVHEKQLGDLVIKFVEHFLPLFVDTYSAAPYRLGYKDFHPERALGFLSHELDYTHLRMIWRRWQKKADISIFGQPVTPFGPLWLDRLISGIFRLRGDFLPDLRLIDYLVCLLSTPRSPALDGRIGNSDKLKKDLADLGVFDHQMSLYLLYKLREFNQMGFSGFEGRHYSLFASLSDDMTHAVNLQLLITALAYKLVVQGDLNHSHIPDDPSIESERRQMFFASAIGLPTCHVRRNNGNLLLQRILTRAGGTRPSRRYPGYTRVQLADYRKALLSFIKEEGADLIEMMGMEQTIEDLTARLTSPGERTAGSKLTAGILKELNSSSPMSVEASEFNSGAERYYRTTLRWQHMREAFDFLEEDCTELERMANKGMPVVRRMLNASADGGGIRNFVSSTWNDLRAERIDSDRLQQLISLLLLSIHTDRNSANSHLQETYANGHAASVR